MESASTMTNDQFISMHRNQINPVLHPKSTLTFAYAERKYGKFEQRILKFDLLICAFSYLMDVVTVCILSEKMTRQMAGEDNKLRTKIL